jgi:3-deoxy-manno-octulosonate cytidylyltransferase (CMP-KDO synthetase)
VIPARLGSTRLARKPLQLLGGRPLVLRVLERVNQLGIGAVVVVATDSSEVQAIVERAGGRALMTSPHHQTGTERVAEVAARAEFARFEVILNVQGDEPFLPRAAASGALDQVTAGAEVGTAAIPLGAEGAGDPNRVKVVMDRSGRALYFSRSPIPYHAAALQESAGGYWQHLGVYAYTREALARWVAAEPTPLERIERLEQLRALDLGLRVGVARIGGGTTGADGWEGGIDTAEDLARAERRWLAFEIGERTR